MASAGPIKSLAAPAQSRAQTNLHGTLAPMRAAGALFVVSAGTLSFEILLTRLFSLVFQYHFAFLAISLAVLGLGFGALLAGMSGMSRSESAASLWLPRAVLLFSVSLPLAALGFSQLAAAGLIFLVVLFGLLPFAAAGLFSSLVYALHRGQSARLYAVDLLGAVCGLAVSPLLVVSMGAFNAAFLIGILAALTAVFLLSGRGRSIALGAALLITLGLGASLAGGWLDLPLSQKNAPPDKVMYHVLSDPAQDARVIDTRWSPFARVDLVETSDPDQRFVFSDAGAGSFMIRFDGDLAPVSWLKEQPGYLPFTQGPVERTLILGAGAGKDILQALLAGSREITAVEINPEMVAITRQHASYNGDIYDRPGVQAVVADGRNFIERSTDMYDLIYLNLVYSQAASPSGAALTESYIFTEEAFRAYWNHLAPDGRLAIVSHQPLEGSRALLTAVSALESEGLKSSEVLRRSTLVMAPSEDANTRLSVLILRKQPLTQEAVAAFSGASMEQGMQALYVPGVFEITLRGLTNDAITVKEFVSGDEYNLLPTRDNQPFFFNLSPGLPAVLRNLLIAVLAACGLYLGLLLVRRFFGKDGARGVPSVWQLLYFGLIGMGFMLIEVALIQRFILLLGSPTLSLVVTLGALLLGAGIGSLLSGSWTGGAILSNVMIAAAAVAALALLAAFFQPAFTQAILPAPLGVRVLSTVFVLFLLGLPMGIPFASGLRLAEGAHPQAIALLWGWNAMFGVLGSVLATVLAIQVGFQVVLIAGAGCYLALAGLTALTRFRQTVRLTKSMAPGIEKAG